MVWAAKAAIFELSRTPNQDTAQLIVELLHEVLSEKGLFSVVMTVAGWIGAAILAALTGVLLYLNRKQKQRLDELEKGGTHERIADTHSDNRGDHRRLRD